MTLGGYRIETLDACSSIDFFSFVKKEIIKGTYLRVVVLADRYTSELSPAPSRLPCPAGAAGTCVPMLIKEIDRRRGKETDLLETGEMTLVLCIITPSLLFARHIAPPSLKGNCREMRPGPKAPYRSAAQRQSVQVCASRTKQ